MSILPKIRNLISEIFAKFSIAGQFYWGARDGSDGEEVLINSNLVTPSKSSDD